jgi:GT2 family glycosyltransferase
MSVPQVMVIVLNWNLLDDTCRCVSSLRQSDYPNLTLVVVDNGSDPNLYSELRSRLSDDVKLLRSEMNLGFAEGNNLGLRYALEQSADYVLVINNDTVVAPDMVRRLVAVAEAQPDAGLLGPVIYYLQAPEQVWFAGYRFSHGIYILRRGLHLTSPIQPTQDVDFVSGCGMLIRRSVLEQVGMFSNEYFMYYEDVDLCFRVKAAGMRIVCVTDAHMWHAVSTSSGGPDSPIKQYYQVKSSLIFYRKHFRGLKLWLNIALRFGHAAFTLFKAIVRRQLKWDAVKMFLLGTQEGWRLPVHPLLSETKPISPVVEHPLSDRQN